MHSPGAGRHIYLIFKKEKHPMSDAEKEVIVFSSTT
jgi:hypothetical protein